MGISAFGLSYLRTTTRDRLGLYLKVIETCRFLERMDITVEKLNLKKKNVGQKIFIQYLNEVNQMYKPVVDIKKEKSKKTTIADKCFSLIGYTRILPQVKHEVIIAHI